MSEVTVPNLQPSVDPGAVRLACIGEAPAESEVSWSVCSQGHGFAGKHWFNRQLITRDRCPVCGSRNWKLQPRPFSGESGRLLDDLLAEAGLPRERVFVGNCCRVPLADSEKRLDTPEVRSGLARLAVDLESFSPNCVLVLGNLALSAFLGEGKSVTTWRGSIAEGWLDGRSFKVVVAVHPASVLREPSQLVLLRKDIARAVEEASCTKLALPLRKFQMGADAGFILEFLRGLIETPLPVGFDIEGSCDAGITVCSIAPSPAQAVSIPFKRLDFSEVWEPDERSAIWEALRLALECPAIPKVTWNGLYEAFCFAWLHGIKLANIEDGMLMWSVLFPELEKGLDVVASLLTREPHWGKAGNWETDEERDRYNCIDSAVTLECWQAMQPLLTADQRRFYEHQRALLEPVLDMMLRGFRYDAAARAAMVAQVQREVFAMTGELDSLAGIAPPTFGDVAETVCFKRAQEKIKTWQDVLVHAKPSFREPL